MKVNYRNFRITAVLVAVLLMAACNKNKPSDSLYEAGNQGLAPTVTTTDSDYVEGVAGGIMTTTNVVDAVVVAVDHEKRTATLQGPKDGEMTVRVGKGAVNFYKVAVGTRVRVTLTEELQVYVEDGTRPEPTPDQTVTDAPNGDGSIGMVVESKKTTGIIKTIDQATRKVQISFGNAVSTFDVRPDVDLTQYAADQEVVFLTTEMLAISVEIAQ